MSKRDQSPIYRTPLRGTIVTSPMPQSGVFNTSSSLVRTPPVDLRSGMNPYTKRKETAVARKKKEDAGPASASYASTSDIIRDYDPDLLTEMEHFGMKSKKMAKSRFDPRPIPPPMMNPSRPGASPKPMSKPGLGGMVKAAHCPECGAKFSKRGLCKCGTMGKAMTESGYKNDKYMFGNPNKPRPYPITKPSPNTPKPPRPTIGGGRPTQPLPPRGPGRPGKPYRPEKPDMGLMPVAPTPIKLQPVENRLSHTMGKMAKGAMCPNCGNKMTKGMCKCMGKAAGHKVDKKLVMFNTREKMDKAITPPMPIAPKPKPIQNDKYMFGTPNRPKLPTMPMRAAKMAKDQGAYINGKKASVTKKK